MWHSHFPHVPEAYFWILLWLILALLLLAVEAVLFSEPAIVWLVMAGFF